MELEAKTKMYHVRNSEKCYRFKPEAIQNHAPAQKGIYELVTFDENQNPKILYIGAAFHNTIEECLRAHAAGTLDPKVSELLARHPNLYFDFLSEMDAKTKEDAEDIYWWLVNNHKPLYNNLDLVHSSGRYPSIQVHEE